MKSSKLGIAEIAQIIHSQRFLYELADYLRIMGYSPDLKITDGAYLSMSFWFSRGIGNAKMDILIDVFASVLTLYVIDGNETVEKIRIKPVLSNQVAVIENIYKLTHFK